MEPANRISNTNQTSQLSMLANSVAMDKATRKLLLLHAQQLCSAVHCAVSPHLDNFEVATAKIHHVLHAYLYSNIIRYRCEHMTYDI